MTAEQRVILRRMVNLEIRITAANVRQFMMFGCPDDGLEMAQTKLELLNETRETLNENRDIHVQPADS